MLQRWMRRAIFRKYVALNVGDYFWGYAEKVLGHEDAQGSPFRDRVARAIADDERPSQKTTKKVRKKAMEQYLKVSSGAKIGRITRER